MKTLLLIRHAKSSWDQAGLSDFDRPLNERGKNDAPVMAKRVKEKEIELDYLISSPAKRAKKTAKYFAEELNKKINEASVIISRCGYSTVMDLAILKRKSILVPTPGQTEQQYLARYLMQRNFALCIDQEKFRLNHAMQLSDRFDYQLPDFLPAAGLDDAVNEFIRLVKIP